MKKLKLLTSSKRGVTAKDEMPRLIKKINELVEENNRKNDEIREIKKKLRVNAHFHRH